jgi:hypothetical protein
MSTRSYHRQIERVRLEIEQQRLASNEALLKRATAALADDDVDTYERLIRHVLSPATGITSPEHVGEHDRVMDGWRITVTGSLVLALGVAVLVVIFKPPAQDVTGYISLLSGLAGIALGWMFSSSVAPRPAVFSRGSAGTEDVVQVTEPFER